MDQRTDPSRESAAFGAPTPETAFKEPSPAPSAPQDVSQENVTANPVPPQPNPAWQGAQPNPAWQGTQPNPAWQGTQPNPAWQGTQPNPTWQQVNPYAAQKAPYPPQYAAPTGTPGAAVRTRRGSKTRDLVMALLTAVLSFCMVDCLIWADALGFGFAAGAALLLVTGLWYLRPAWRHTGVYTAALVLLFFVGCVSLVFSADTGVKTLTLFCLMILFTCILMDGMNLRVWTAGTFRSVGDFFYTAFAASFGKIGAGMYGLFHREQDENAKRQKGLGKALLGLLIALPVAAILLVLLSSADEAFHGMLDGIDLEKFPEKIYSLILAAPLFILLFSQMFSLRDVRREPKKESDKGLDPTILTFFLVGVSVVYLAYLFSQLAYFFSGFMGFLPEEFTYAEYARRGFFELTAVSVINILIVILGTALSRKKNGRLPLGVRLLSLFLCLFSLVLVGTEVAKMKMYMDTYGLTRLRILTTLFMVFLAVVFLALIVHLFVRRFPYFKVAVIAGVLLTVAVNFISVDRMVAEYNVWAYQSGTLNTVDVETITELGDAAVPALLRLAEDSDPDVSKEARSELFSRWQDLHETGAWDSSIHRYTTGDLKSYDYRGYNLVSYRARQLLLENESMFVPSDAAQS